MTKPPHDHSVKGKTISSLEGFQQDFTQHLLSPELDEASLEFLSLLKQQLPDGDALEEAKTRLNIYRNNVIHSLSCAIGDLYPIVKRLIGDDCFNGAAVAFVRKYPPSNSALLFYGGGFVEFIKDYPACQSLPYLSDVAKLEYYSHRAFHACDSEYLDPASLSQVAPEQLGDLIFDTHPSVELFKSQWPIARIWQENLKQQPDVIDIDSASGCYLLIYRREFEVQVVDLNPHCFHFLQQISQGQSINQAWFKTLQLAQQLASEIEQPIDENELSPILGYLLGLPLFSGFRFQQGNNNE